MKKILTTIVACLISTSHAQPSQSDMVRGFNGFAFELYNQTSKPAENAILSPYSLSSLLAVLVEGSAGSTQNQLQHVLHLNGLTSFTNVSATLDQLNSSLISQDNQNFIIANALWADQNLTYKKSFLDEIQKIKTAAFYRVDFIHTPDQATTQINAWVNKNTNGYIQNLIGSIPSSTRLILTNAIYFKGLWYLPFKPANTRQLPFFQDNGQQSQTAMMMHQEDKFNYAENDSVQLLQLGYTKSSLVMAILLPKKNHTLQEVRQSFNIDMYNRLMAATTYTTVIVDMPKFKVESTFDSLIDSLKTLGLTDAFTPKANFSNMTAEKIAISQIIQKAIIQVDEKGTVAAAATGIMFGAAMSAKPLPPVNFNANHPFLFVIYDNQSGLILFMGQVIKP